MVIFLKTYSMEHWKELLISFLIAGSGLSDFFNTSSYKEIMEGLKKTPNTNDAAIANGIIGRFNKIK